jgi:predicted dehydrogenase
MPAALEPEDEDLEQWLALDGGTFMKTREAPAPRLQPPTARARIRTQRLRLWLVCSSVAAAMFTYQISGIAGRLSRMVTAGPPCSAHDMPAVRFGMLGAAKIAPFGLLHPSRRLPCSVRVVAIGARDIARAARLARSWDIPRHGDYASVLSSRDVEAVYIPLINGMHYEWAAAALKKGKHVLVEKPLTSNAEEARALARLASSRRLVLAEAYHWRHHPIAHRLREVLRSGEVGSPVHLEVTAGMPTPDLLLSWLKSAFGDGQPGGSRRAKMDVLLGGGSFMTQGCYTISVARYLLGEPVRVVNATATEDVPGSRADAAMQATLLFQKGASATVRSSPFAGGFNLHLQATRGSISLTNYLFPHIYHALRVAPAGAPSRVEQLYGNGETTFELQLAAFALAIRRKERFPFTPADAVANMRWIDAVYETASLGRRPGRKSR